MAGGKAAALPKSPYFESDVDTNWFDWEAAYFGKAAAPKLNHYPPRPPSFDEDPMNYLW